MSEAALAVILSNNGQRAVPSWRFAYRESFKTLPAARARAIIQTG